MIRRVLLAAILAGLAAGFVMGVIQHVRLTPLIIQAESYEHMAHGHGTTTEQGTPQVQAHSHDGTEWSPDDGLERSFYTTLTVMLTAAGFALVLTGVSFLSAIPITRKNGLIWGICGFVAVSLAPAIGLPPELPGMPAADLVARQAWWIGTIVCTGLAIWLAATHLNRLPYVVGAAALALAPHVIGAPHAPSEATTLPAALAAEFATGSLGANLVMWLLIGLLLSITLSPHEEAAKP